MIRRSRLLPKAHIYKIFRQKHSLPINTSFFFSSFLPSPLLSTPKKRKWKKEKSSRWGWQETPMVMRDPRCYKVKEMIFSSLKVWRRHISISWYDLTSIQSHETIGIRESTRLISWQVMLKFENLKKRTCPIDFIVMWILPSQMQSSWHDVGPLKHAESCPVASWRQRMVVSHALYSTVMVLIFAHKIEFYRRTTPTWSQW